MSDEGSGGPRAERVLLDTTEHFGWLGSVHTKFPISWVALVLCRLGSGAPGVEQDPDRAETGRDRSPGNHYSLTNSYSSPESTCMKEEPNSAPVRPAHTVHDFT